MEGEYLRIEIESDELHRKIGVGIPKGALMLIEGEDGSGKSIVCQRLLYGFLKNGHTVTYICSEMTMKDFISQMKSIEYRIHEFITTKKLLYIPMFPRVGKVVPREDFLYRLMNAEKLFENEAIIIDTLNSLIKENFSKRDIFEFISFVKKIINSGRTIIITANPSLVDQKVLDLLRAICDIHFKLEIKSIGGDLKRFINIYRFKGSSIQITGGIGFRVEPKIGFVIEIAAVA